MPWFFGDIMSAHSLVRGPILSAFLTWVRFKGCLLSDTDAYGLESVLLVLLERVYVVLRGMHKQAHLFVFLKPALPPREGGAGYFVELLLECGGGS